MVISFCEGGGGILADFVRFIMVFMRENGLQVRGLPARGKLSNIGDILFSVNFFPDLARLARSIKRPYIAWLSSAWVNEQLNAPECVSDYTIMFHFSRQDMEKSRALGYRHSYFLPRPIDVEAIQRVLPSDHTKQYEVSFVGTGYVTNPQSSYREYRRSYQERGISQDRGLRTLDLFLCVATQNLVTPLRRLFLEFIEKNQSDFFDVAPLPPDLSGAEKKEQSANYFLDALLGHEIDAIVRRELLKTLTPLGMHVWGNAEAWAPLQTSGVHYHGYAKQRAELPVILKASRVCVNMPRRFADGPIFRTYEIPACGSLQLALFNKDVACMFEEDREIIFFRTYAEALEKARFYLQHDEAREKIAWAGQARLLKDHTLTNRFEQMKQILAGLGISLRGAR